MRRKAPLRSDIGEEPRESLHRALIVAEELLDLQTNKRQREQRIQATIPTSERLAERCLLCAVKWRSRAD